MKITIKYIYIRSLLLTVVCKRRFLICDENGIFIYRYSNLNTQLSISVSIRLESLIKICRYVNSMDIPPFMFIKLNAHLLSL